MLLPRDMYQMIIDELMAAPVTAMEDKIRTKSINFNNPIGKPMQVSRVCYDGRHRKGSDFCPRHFEFSRTRVWNMDHQEYLKTIKEPFNYQI